MARVSHKRVKQLLNEHRSKITDKQFFTSRILAGHYEDVAAAQTRRYRYDRRVHVNIYWNPDDPNAACTNNASILINAGHPCVTKIKGRMDRYEMVSGLFAHELGHVLYTDFLAKQTYMNYLSKFKWYPAPPDLKTSRDAANERDFWEYVKLDPRNLEFAMQIACYIANVLEDGYIEGRILADFPGVLGYNLSVMRDHQYQDMRTVTQMMEMEDAGSGHIFHTILQIMLSYALYGEIKYGETPLSDERIQTIFRLIPQLDTAVTTASAKERWKIVSLILIRCWHHIEDYIELCKKHQDEAATSGTGSSAGEVLSGLLQVIAGSSAEGTGSEKPVSGSEVRKKLTDAETAYAKLTASEEDKEKAQEVIDLIDKLKDVTPDSEKDIEAARKAYDALTDLQKKLVDKSHIATLLIFLLVIPATLYFGLRLTGRAYYLTSTLVIIEIIIPFLLAFESRRPQARELVVIAVLSALAVAARVAIPIPNFKAIFAIIMLSGIAFGPEAGFLVGAVSAFASNFFYGQGAYTPWQMFAYGAGGMLAGFLFAKGRLPQKRWVMAAFGFLACVLFVGPLLDTCTVFLTLPIINAQTAWPLYISGFPVNISQGVCTALTMVLFGPALLEKLERVKLQYGMTEDDDGV